MTIFIDFDGTIVEHDFPEIGKPLDGAFDTMLSLKEAGYKLVLWTCREDQPERAYLSEAVEFCNKNGIEFDSVNDTLLWDEFRKGELKRKPYYDYCIDDRNLGGFLGWDWVRQELLPVILL
jgi:hydroxymethylpyrimidine pyrophosphatase-like HAD family hydrolase